jgi:DNA-directed RNA polymerase III subunit RPC2
MPPKSKVALAKAAAQARAAAAAAAATPDPAPVPSTSSLASAPTLADLPPEPDFPPAVALPSEPMDLDETQEDGHGDTEMADPVEGKGTREDGEMRYLPEDKPVKKSVVDKGKGKAREGGEMKGLQNVGDLQALGDGMEGMGEQVWKGKGLTDSIKAVEASSSFGRRGRIY